MLFISILFSCNNEKNSIKTKEKESISLEFLYNLQENITMMGSVKDASFCNNSLFVLSDNNIIEYTSDGEQKNVFKKQGQGPGEYIMPTLLNIENNSLYVWCASTLKLIEYSKEGVYKREITSYRKAIKNFKIFNDFIIFYKSDGKTDALIDIFSVKENKIIKSVVNLTHKDLLLLSVNNKPNMIVEGENLYFTKPSELAVYELNLKTFSLSKKIRISDNEFKVEELKDAPSLFNTDIKKVIDFMSKNSIVDNLLKVENNFYIKAEVGQYIFDVQKNTMETKSRFDKYYFCGSDLIATKIPKKLANQKYILHNGNIYFIYEDPNKEENRVKILKLTNI